MMIVKNQSFHEVKIKLMGFPVESPPHDEVLLDNAVGEALQEIQPGLHYSVVRGAAEDEAVKRFEQKAKDDLAAKKAEEKRVKKQIADMNEMRAEMAEKKRLKREKLAGIKPEAKAEKVVAKVPAKIKKVSKKK